MKQIQNVKEMQNKTNQRTLEEVLNNIEHARRFGKEPGVKVTAQVLQQLDHPESNLPYIHVAGTNGKGSVCAFLEQLAMQSGKRVGKFTSPHLIRFNERITVNQKEISDEAIVRLGNFLLEQDFGVELTMFDYCLVMAILYFKEQNCDVVILETGLGGRLDSTEALKQNPLACVITRIGYDHMAILGNTLKEIAGEKAGIIRENVPVISAPQEPEAGAVISAVAEKMAPGLYGEVTGADLEALRNIPLRMIGEYQLENAATALKAFRMIHAGGMTIEEEQLALSKATWPGRMEILWEKPFLMVDGAHNSNGVEALANSLKALYPKEKFRFVMGVLADKDYLKMIELLLPMAESFVTVTPESSRALQGRELAELIQSRGVEAHFEPDWKHYLLHLKDEAKDESINESINESKAESINESKEDVKSDSAQKKVICFGSLYFIGAVKKFLQDSP